MCCMLTCELRCVLGGNRSESGIIILYSASEQGTCFWRYINMHYYILFSYHDNFICNYVLEALRLNHNFVFDVANEYI